MTIYMCARCGCTKWYVDYTTSGTTRTFSSLEDGPSYDTEDLDNDYDSGDETGPYCQDCDAEDMLEIEGFTDAEIEYLRNCSSREERVSIHTQISGGESIDEIKPAKPRKGKLIGGYPIQ